MALRRMGLNDFVIVKSLVLELTDGFTVLTGETGAGKSILIDALQLCLGARADATTIREGAKRTEIWAEFDVPTPHSASFEWLTEGGFDTHEALVLRRTIDSDGKSRGWINASPATAGQLRQLGEQLVDIHGQHAWAALTRSDDVRSILDTYADIDTDGMVQAYRQWQEAENAWQTAQQAHSQHQLERDHLLWQVDELRNLAPNEGEWEQLNLQHGRLANAQALLDACHLALTLLDQEDGGVMGGLAKSHHTLTLLQHTEPAFVPIAQELAESLAQTQDAAHSLQAYLRKTDLDPAHLAELDDRIGQWMTLARRFKTPPETLPALLAEGLAALLALDAATDLEALGKQVQTSFTNYQAQAHRVSLARQQAAPQLGQAVTTTMQTLGMQGGQLVVDLERRSLPSASGLEDVRFLVAGHAGTTPKPIAKVASGGELSRIALALSVVTNETGSAPTVIFDEVDAGIGGAVAQSVGCLMQSLGQRRQVMAVTHLPQVAAYAHQHLQVTKLQHTGQIVSQIQSLDAANREVEISRMLGGDPMSGTSLAHAREMLILGTKGSAYP